MLNVGNWNLSEHQMELHLIPRDRDINNTTCFETGYIVCLRAGSSHCVLHLYSSN